MAVPHVDFPQTFCRGAIARRDITPPVGMYHRMWGAATHDRSTGIHRPLSTTALLLAPSGAKGDESMQALVSIDHCLLWTEEMEALAGRVCRDCRIEPEQLQITFSHTHGAGLLDPKRADQPGGDLIAPYLETLAGRIVEAVGDARDALRPVSIVYGQGHCDLATQRDFWDAESRQFVCGFDPAGLADDTLLVARISDEQGQTLGTIVNYACHPTTLAWDNTLVSPDYVGAMRETVESAAGGLCMFLQGASGDLGPREGFVGDTDVADRNGRRLAHAALAALDNLPAAGLRFEYTGPVISGATIGTWAYRVLPAETLCQKHAWDCRRFAIDLPYRADLPRRTETEADLGRWQAEERQAAARGDAAAARDYRAQVERSARQLARLRSLPDRAFPLEVSLWRLGDAIWVAVQGEHYHLLQRALRQRFADRPVVVTTITNGWQPGYLPTAKTYGEGIYQESIAAVAPGSLEQVIEAIAAALQGA